MIRNLPPRDGGVGRGPMEFESPEELQRRLEEILQQKFGNMGAGREIYKFSRMRNVERVGREDNDQGRHIDSMISLMNQMSDEDVGTINMDNLERVIQGEKKDTIEYDYYDDLEKWTNPKHFASDIDTMYRVKSKIRTHLLDEPPEELDTAESLKEKIKIAQAVEPPAIME